ncbi:MAG: ribosome rescue protein RqcH [Candidatus Bathyarchaeota archaeon]|nr:ribosome rescue protein RqcH [Candidatus Bathyarchaeota archaeon]
MKERMTSFDIAALTPELNRLIKDARIDNIYQINPLTLLLKLRRPNQPKLHLLIEAGKRLHLTSYVLKKPQKPPTFCMALRKHLRNGKIKGIRQHEFERIIIIEVSEKEGNIQLISELFGEGNIILVDQENRILQALTYRRMRDRNVLRGEVFQQPPSSGRNPLKQNRQGFNEIRELGQLEIVRALTKFLSIGGHYAEEILLRAEVDKKAPCDSLAERELDRIFDQLQHILSIISAGNVEPCVVIGREGEWIDVTPLPLKKYAHFSQKRYETFDEALDDYYMKMTLDEGVVETAKGVEREMARQQRILQRQQKALEDLKGQIERNKGIGNLIYLHFGDLQSLLQKIMDEKRSGKPWEEIVLSIEKGKKAGRVPDIYFDSLKPPNLILNVSVENSIFPLNLRRSIQANATKYYAGAKKAEKKLEGAEKALRETQAKIEELKQRIGRVKEIRKPLAKRRIKAWYEKFRWFHSSDGFLVLGGRDATTNEILIKKQMEPHDIVLHADILGAPFVLIKTGEKTPPERTIRESAQLAASYSRAWREMLSAVDVYWVNPEQVNKSPPSGQYLRKGAFIIHGSKNFVRGVPLRVAIGVKMKEEQTVIVGGPVEAIGNQTNVYVELIPGEQKSSELAKQIRRLLAERASKALKKRILEIPLEEIQRFIPLGRGKTKVYGL